MKMTLLRTVVTTLTASFLLGSGLAASAVSVTFRVNLEVQATLGNFIPGSHTIEVHGSFNGWGPGITLSASSANPNIYEGAIDISGSPGSVVQYKFVINKSGTQVWENDGVGPAGAQNRALNLPDAPQVLAVVFFNNQATPPGVVAVTFQVNLQVQEAISNFDPATHSIEVHGSFDGWGPGITLSASPTNAQIYQGTANVT